MFTQYNLHPNIIEALNAKQVYTPTPIQDLVLTSGKSRFAMIAPTGTGKTISYAIPLLQKLKM
jgi:superfamily II DNA/RNA helicase